VCVGQKGSVADPTTKKEEMNMAMLIAAALVFLGIHFLISGTPARDWIVSVIGEQPYRALFSIASLITIVWLVISYNRASTSTGDQLLYATGTGIRDAGIIIVAVAFLLGIQGLFVRNPTSVQQESAASRADTVQGVIRITRHPFLWGVVLWAGFHLAANGDLASIIFFGTFFLLAFFGTFLIDAKRQRKLGAAWEAFSARTSNVPFVAIAQGRNEFKTAEMVSWRFWAAFALFLILLFAHYRLFHFSPFPGGWIPF
jgi:uncharacterized membrane protein